MDHLIIYNPNASNGRAAKKVDAVRSELHSSGIHYEMLFTEEPNHAARLAAENSHRYDVIVAAGGDGTINEVINGIMLAGQKDADAEDAADAADAEVPTAALGVLCVGRGNDFAYGASIPKTLREACGVLKAGARKRIDIGLITGDEVPDGRYFCNGIGIGFDTIVGIEASKISWAQGFLGYLIGAVKTIFFFDEPPTLRLKTDGSDASRPMIQISAMNGRRMGGAFLMAPEARIDDGLFDLCVALEPNRREMLKLIVQFMKGNQAGSRHIEFLKTARLEVFSTDGAIVMHADGETICTSGNSITAEIVPGGLEVVYASEGF